MPDNSHNRLVSAILETVAYADIFDHALTVSEIHRYLSGVLAPFETLQEEIKNAGGIVRNGDYVTLPGREEIIPVRKQRKAYSQSLLPLAMQFGRMLSSLPFVRMVALTGSLAILNVSKTDDFDYMLVTVPGRVWTARAFAVLFTRIARRFGHILCPNLIVSRNSLEWPLHDLYSARELCQMVPITGLDVYRELIEANAWARTFLPNAFSLIETVLRVGSIRRSPLQKVAEYILSGRVGNRFEHWEMTRKIRRFTEQEGFGDETVFNAEVCQGNFHHHRKWTHEAYLQRLDSLLTVEDRTS